MKKLSIILFLLAVITNMNAQDSSKPPIVPNSAFGHWIWEDSEHTSKTIRYMVEGYTERNIPVNTVIFDSPWSSAYNNFEWDTILYPDYRELIGYLHNKDIRVLLWYTGIVNLDSRV